MQEELIRRREFLLQIILAASAVSSMPFTAHPSTRELAKPTEKQGKQKKRELIKAFCIDFNWEPNVGHAKPGTFTQADPEAHVRWYKDLGANTIQTFCVSFNGYAWYSDSAVAPVNPGLEKKNFLAQMCQCGHDARMKVMGYFTFGNNPVWEAKNPDLRKDEGVDYIRIPATLEWLDYFCRQVEDALKKTDIDGFLVDWIRPVQHTVWIEAEKRMWRELMGEKFSSTGSPSPEAALEFDKMAMARAWQHIQWAADATRKVTIWTNQPFVAQEKPMWEGHRMLKEVDWVLNEAPDIGWLDWLQQQVGEETLVMQNLCGWPDHDASVWEKINTRKFGLYGFAQADVNTTYPLESFKKNIEIIRQAYRRTK
jgi:hypothetical protein